MGKHKLNRNSKLRKAVKQIKYQKQYDDSRRSSFWQYGKAISKRTDDNQDSEEKKKISQVIFEQPEKSSSTHNKSEKKEKKQKNAETKKNDNKLANEVKENDKKTEKKAKKPKDKKKKEEKKVSSGNETEDLLKSIPIPTLQPIAPLHKEMVNKLSSAQFRYLNEYLYTHPSEETYKYFQQNPHLFKAYHEGYEESVKTWPVQPVDVAIEWLNSEHNRVQDVVGDFGCGDAKIAAGKTVKQKKVYSFDLVSVKPNVIACDMRAVPLPSKTLNVAVFCLSLMGENWIDYLIEANRVLKLGGRLFIAEVESRIIIPKRFLGIFSKMGFHLLEQSSEQKKVAKKPKRKRTKDENDEVIEFGHNGENNSYENEEEEEDEEEEEEEEEKMSKYEQIMASGKGYFNWFVFKKVRDDVDVKTLKSIKPNDILKPCLYKKR